MKDFTLYSEALELKQLGFDEPCLGYYLASSLFISNDNVYNSTDIPVIKAPLYSQAFRWLREKHSLESFILPSVNEQDKTIYTFAFGNLSKSVKYDFEDKIDYQFEDYDTYEEAELACLRHLIKLVKK
jgi:hypothetical protein